MSLGPAFTYHTYAQACSSLPIFIVHGNTWACLYPLCYNWYFLLNGLSTFSLVHLILSQHVIILSQSMLSFIYFLMRSTISLILSQLSFNLHAMHGYAFFSSLPFHASHITHVYASILCTAYLISTTHSPGLRIFLMHSVLVDSIQSCTNIMSSI